MPYLPAAITSILAQSFADFEFLIRNDGSDDGSRGVLDDWARRDARVRVFHGNKSLGPAGSSNWIANKARADLVARMDADDVSAPDRLARQVAALDENADAVMIGTLWNGIDSSGRQIRGQDRWRLTHTDVLPPFPHGSIMYRRAAFDAVGGYREISRHWEDADLALRLAAQGRVLVIADALYEHRFSSASSRTSSRQPEVQAAVDLALSCMESYRQTGSYEALLKSARQADRAVNPRAFVSIASNVLWSGRRPHGLRQLLSRARIGADRDSLYALSWFVAAQLSPALLRAAMRATIRSRDGTAREQIRQGGLYEWRPSLAIKAGKRSAAAET